MCIIVFRFYTYFCYCACSVNANGVKHRGSSHEHCKTRTFAYVYIGYNALSLDAEQNTSIGSTNPGYILSRVSSFFQARIDFLTAEMTIYLLSFEDKG